MRIRYTHILFPIRFVLEQDVKKKKKETTRDSDRSSNDIILYSLEKEQNFFGKRLEQIELIVKSSRRI